MSDVENLSQRPVDEEINLGELVFEDKLADYLVSIGFSISDESIGDLGNAFHVIRNLKKFEVIHYTADIQCFPFNFGALKALAIISSNSAVALVESGDNVFAREGLEEEDEECGMILPRTQIARINYFQMVEGGYSRGFIAVSRSISDEGITGMTRMSFGSQVQEIPPQGSLNEDQVFVQLFLDAFAQA